MTISVIVELHAKPGRRDFNTFLETMATEHGPSQSGSIRSRRYEVVDDPDTLVEIAEWQSAEAHQAHMEKGAATGAYAPLTEMLAAPLRATVIRPLPREPRSVAFADAVLCAVRRQFGTLAQRSVLSRCRSGRLAERKRIPAERSTRCGLA